MIKRVGLLLTLMTLCISAEIIGPYLHTPSESSIYVLWITTSGSDGTIKWGSSESALTNSVTAEYLDMGWGVQVHYGKIEGMEADSYYHYTVTTGSETSPAYRFKTQPSDGTYGKYLFAVMGDHQVRDKRYEQLVDACKAKVVEKYGGKVEDHLRLVVCVGDQVDEGNKPQQYVDCHFSKSDDIARHVPFMTVIGNHELYNNGLNNYLKFFPTYNETAYKGIVGSDGVRYYAFQVARILFVMMDSNLKVPQQISWLKQVVEAGQSDNSIDWINAVNHHCVVAEQMPGDASSYVANDISNEILKSPKTAMHLTGHAHLYARGAHREKPVYQVINGGASWDQYWGQDPKQVDYADVQKTLIARVYQLVEIDFDKQKMHVETWSTGNLDTLWDEQVKIDEFWRDIQIARPARPFIDLENSSVPLNTLIKGSSYAGDDDFNSTQFQVASSENGFANPGFDLKRDFENLFGQKSGGARWETEDLNEGVDIFSFRANEQNMQLGSNWVRVRYRDRSMNWSDWSDATEVVLNDSTLIPSKDPIIFIPLDENGEEYKDRLPSPTATGVTFEEYNDGNKQCATFSGTGSLLYANSSPFDLGLPSRQMTVSCRVNAQSFQEWGGYVGFFQDNGDTETGWVLGAQNNKFSFGLAGTDKKTMTYLAAPTSANTNQWYHVAATYDGSTMTLFVDGKEVATSTAQSGKIFYSDKSYFSVGTYKDDNEDHPLTGSMDEVLIWERALDPEEIKDLYEEYYDGTAITAVASQIMGHSLAVHRDAMTLTVAEAGEVTILDTKGRVLNTKELIKGYNKHSLKSLPNGVYIATVRVGNRVVHTRRFIR